MATNFPGGVDDFAGTSPTNLGDNDSTGRAHSARHNDIELAMEAVQTYAPRDRRWVRGSTANAADDEFNNASLDGAWTRVDAAGGSGRAAWTESADSLALTLVGGDAAAELHGLVRAHSLAVGDYVETHMRMAWPVANYLNAGLILANGATHGSGDQIYWSRWNYSTAPLQEAYFTGYNTRSSFNETAAVAGSDSYLRVLRDASNVWRFYTSANGATWYEVYNRTLTMTPTHVGLAGGSWGASKCLFAFDYFRVGTA